MLCYDKEDVSRDSCWVTLLTKVMGLTLAIAIVDLIRIMGNYLASVMSKYTLIHAY